MFHFTVHVHILSAFSYFVMSLCLMPFLPVALADAAQCSGVFPSTSAVATEAPIFRSREIWSGQPTEAAQ